MPPQDKIDTEKLIRPEAVQHLLETIESKKFFGEVIVKLKDGKIVQVEIRKSFIDEEQIYDAF
jgi:hypothetical protein